MKVERKHPPEVDKIILAASDNYGIQQVREGIHCTDCIYCPRKGYWNKTEPLPPTQKELLYFLLGLGLQTALLGGDNPSVAELDGIIISPDYWEGGVLGELKTTRMTEKSIGEKGIPDGWVKQLMAYAYVLGVTQALLIVIPIIRPDIVPYVLTFEQGELVDNWRSISTRGAILQTALLSGQVPNLKGEEWECRSGCRYKLRCDVKDG